MSTEVSDFLWSVPEAGFEWSNLDSAPVIEEGRLQPTRNSRVLVPVVGSALKPYTPLLTSNGLFRTFSLKTKPNEESLKAFANRYGTLGLRAVTYARDEHFVHGETLIEWGHELGQLRHAVQLYDQVQSKQLRELASVFKWVKRGVQYQGPGGDYALIASPNHHPEVLSRLQNGDVLEPAKWYLQQVINNNLGRHRVAPKLLWDSTTPGRQVVRIVPTNLIGCMWLQFAHALEGREYRQCDNCLDWFEVGGSRAARSDKKFCSATCRAGYAYRKHKKTQLKKTTKNTKGVR